MNTFAKSRLVVVTATWLIALSGCGADDMVKEDTSKLITEVTLVFTNHQGASARVIASDRDGEGEQGLVADKPIALVQNATYTMTIKLINGLVTPNSPHYDVSAKVADESDVHMFFFGWTNDLFSNPTGDGNIDGRSGQVNYFGASDSVDSNGMPLGLTTRWTTASATGSGTFRIILKHLPAFKTSNTGTDVGETDLDVTFDILVE